MKRFTKTHVALLVLFVCLSFICSCQTTNSKIIVSHYRYDMEDNSFRIRSVNCQNEGECYNELIGENFIAVDFNQDRIIDRIVMGDADISKVQKIYEYGLSLLSRENKLEEHVSDVRQYVQEETCCRAEIKSFRLKDTAPFNQLILVEDRNTINPRTTAAIDQDADGTLDMLLKGDESLEQMQTRYDSMIQLGLENNSLIRKDSKILVKEKSDNM